MELNLPRYDFNISKDECGRATIWDRLRRKYVALTPEEWVRQHFTRFLIEERGFPEGLMANEVSLTQNGIHRRCDTLIADKTGEPLAIVEYKAPSVAVTQRTFDQIARYNMVLRAKFLMVSNGITHYCCHMDYKTNNYHFLPDIPFYQLLANDE